MEGRDTSGKFVKGHRGFKPPGAQSELRQNIKSFLATEWPNFATWFKTLKEPQKIETFLALLPFVIGKLNAIAHTDAEGNNLPDQSPNFDCLSDEELRFLAAIQDKINAPSHE